MSLILSAATLLSDVFSASEYRTFHLANESLELVILTFPLSSSIKFLRKSSLKSLISCFVIPLLNVANGIVSEVLEFTRLNSIILLSPSTSDVGVILYSHPSFIGILMKLSILFWRLLAIVCNASAVASVGTI